MKRDERRLYDEAESLIRKGPRDRPGESRPNDTWTDVMSEIGDFVKEAEGMIERLKDAYDTVCDERDELEQRVSELEQRVSELESADKD